MAATVNRRRLFSQCSSNLDREGVRCVTVRTKPLQRRLDKDTPVDILGGGWERELDDKTQKEDEMRRIIRVSVPTNPRTPVVVVRQVNERDTHGRREGRQRGGLARRALLFDRDPMWGRPWDSEDFNTASTSNCSTPPNTPKKSPATTPIILRTPTNTIVLLRSPSTPKKLCTPTKTRTPNTSPKSSPISPSFKAFIDEEMAFMQDTSPLKAVLNMGNFWSPHASRAKLDDSPGFPKISLTPTASAISPWKGAGPVPFSPSLFIVQAALMADGPVRTEIYRPLHCYK